MTSLFSLCALWLILILHFVDKGGNKILFSFEYLEIG